MNRLEEQWVATIIAAVCLGIYLDSFWAGVGLGAALFTIMPMVEWKRKP